MKQTVNFSDFIANLNAHNRLRTDTKGGNFDYDGARVLFNWIEEVESDIGNDIELDVVALCCDYAQSAPADIAADYGIDISDCADDDAVMECVLDYLNDRTSVCGSTDDSIVYQQF